MRGVSERVTHPDSLWRRQEDGHPVVDPGQVLVGGLRQDRAAVQNLVTLLQTVVRRQRQPSSVD